MQYMQGIASLMTSSAHIIGSKESGGAERFFVRLVKALRQAGHQAHAVCPPDSKVAHMLADTVQATEIRMRGNWDILARHQITQTIKNIAPDIVQTYMGRATRLTHLPPHRRPVHIARLGGYYKLKAYRHAHAWIGNTKGICDHLIKGGFPADRVFFIGNFIDPSPPSDPEHLRAMREKLGIPAEAWCLLSVGRLHPNKGFPDLIDAMSLLPRDIANRPLHLIIVGDGPLRDALQQHTSRLGLRDRIHWTGWQNDPTPYYDMTDLFICPSRHEPLGNVILEAWNHKRPVISTSTLGANELVTSGENGILVPIENPRAIASTVQELLNDPQQSRDKLSEQGYRSLISQHSPEAVIKAYLNLYENLSSAEICAG
jgi:glycosyltransferase involved in cell wall biosynthesis